MRPWFAVGLALLLGGCRQASFYHQPVQRNLRPNPASGWTRQAVPGTVARGQADEADPDVSGTADRSRAGLPIPVNRTLLDHGRERFDIYCAPCHGRAGYGDGLVVQRGFPRPPSLHDASLRGVGEGWIVYVLSHGYGRMASYGDRVQGEDRWAIAAYVKALQLSQDFPVATLTADEREHLERPAPLPPSPTSENSPRPGTVVP